jgi:hypothetical protein
MKLPGILPELSRRQRNTAMLWAIFVWETSSMMEDRLKYSLVKNAKIFLFAGGGSTG